GRRDAQPPTPARPPVDPAPLAELADPGNDPVRDPRERERSLVAEPLAKPREVAPVAMHEPAVAAARTSAALVRLEHDDAQVGVTLLQRERRPEARVAAADDRDVGLCVTVERRGRLRVTPLGGERLLQPPDQT